MDEINRLAAALEGQKSSQRVEAENPPGEIYEKPPERPVNDASAQGHPARAALQLTEGSPSYAGDSPPSALSSGVLAAPICSPSSPLSFAGARTQWQASSAHPSGFGSTISLGHESFDQGRRVPAKAGTPHRLVLSSPANSDRGASPTSHFDFATPTGQTLSDQPAQVPLTECQAVLDSALAEIERRVFQPGLKGAKDGEVGRALELARARLGGTSPGPSAGLAARSSAGGIRSREEAQRGPASRQLGFVAGIREARSPSEDASCEWPQRESASLLKLQESIALRSR